MPSSSRTAVAATVRLLPGLLIVGGLSGAAYLIAEASQKRVSALVIGLILGALYTNLGLPRAAAQPGFTFAAKRLLRLGILLLGFRLSAAELADVGLPGLAMVIVVVAATFFGAHLVGRRMGISPGLTTLIATGYSICGASAIAAMKPMTDADDDEVAYAVSLVTLAGTTAIVVLPPLGRALGMDATTFGTWVGASVHDVGQVIAAASGWHGGPSAVDESRKSATVVKLARVVLLAPLVAGVGWRHRSSRTASSGTRNESPRVRRTAPVPLFVIGFLLAALVSSLDVLPAGTRSGIKLAEGLLLTAALVGLGTSVDIKRLRRLGGRPLRLGALLWAVLIVGSYALVRLVGLVS